MVSLTTTTSSPAALPAASTTAPASSVSPAANKRPHLAGVDAPWHAAATGSTGISPVPRIHHARMLRVAQDDSFAYALAVIKVEIQVWKIYCINRPIPTIPINLASAARSEAEFEKVEQAGEKLLRVGQDTRLNYRAIDLRTPANQAIF